MSRINVILASASSGLPWGSGDVCVTFTYLHSTHYFRNQNKRSPDSLDLPRSPESNGVRDDSSAGEEAHLHNLSATTLALASTCVTRSPLNRDVPPCCLMSSLNRGIVCLHLLIDKSYVAFYYESCICPLFFNCSIKKDINTEFNFSDHCECGSPVAARSSYLNRLPPIATTTIALDSGCRPRTSPSTVYYSTQPWAIVSLT